MLFRSGGDAVEDWVDYAGYDATPPAQLARDMQADVERFVGRLLARKLRLARGGRALEWQDGDRWSRAVPLAADST